MNKFTKETAAIQKTLLLDNNCCLCRPLLCRSKLLFGLSQTKSVLQNYQVCEFRLIQIVEILTELSENHVAKCFLSHTKSVTSQHLSDLLQGSELQNSD